MRLKEEYVGSTVSHNGIRYDLSKMNEEKLMRVYENVPSLRYIFEEVTPVEYIEVEEEVNILDEEKFFKNKPEDKTEEEYFNETIKKVTKRKK